MPKMGKFVAIGHDSKLIGATITKLWIILERHAKGLRICLVY